MNPGSPPFGEASHSPLILAVAIRELYVKIELMKIQFGDLSSVGDLAGIQSFLKAL